MREDSGTAGKRQRKSASYMDPVDRKIVLHLKKDSSATMGEIGAKMGLSNSAVRRRVKRLRDTGIIKRFTVEVSYDDSTSAILLISVDATTDTATVSQVLAELEGVRTVYEITGQFDITAIISAPAISEINSIIDSVRNVQGVADTNTMIILRKVP